MIDVSGPEFILGIILFVLVKIVSVIAAIGFLLYLLASKTGQPLKRVVAGCATAGFLLLNLQGWHAGHKYDEWVQSGTPPYSYGEISDKGIYIPKQVNYTTINSCSNYQANYTIGCAPKLKTLLFFGMFDFTEYGIEKKRRLSIFSHDERCLTLSKENEPEDSEPRFEGWLFHAQDICYVSEGISDSSAMLQLNGEIKNFQAGIQGNYLEFTLIKLPSNEEINRFYIWNYTPPKLPLWIGRNASTRSYPNTDMIMKNGKGPICDILSYNQVCEPLWEFGRSNAFERASICAGDCFGDVVFKQFGLDEERLLRAVRSADPREVKEGIEGVCRHFTAYLSDEFKQAFVESGDDPDVPFAERIKRRVAAGNCI